MIPITVLRSVYENLEYFPIDDLLLRVTEKEAKEYGFNSRKELIKHELNDFFSDEKQMAGFIKCLEHDIKICHEDLPDLCESYKITINYLQNIILKNGNG